MNTNVSTSQTSGGVAGVVWLAIALWFAAVLSAGTAGVFKVGPAEPPLPLLVALTTPVAVFALAYAGWTRFRDFALGLDLRVLTAMQGWRVLGGMFLVFYAYDMLPGLFAWPAGLGDVLVGLAAPFVVLAMVTGAAGWRRRVYALNIAGLLDFVGALGAGILTSNSAFGFLAGGVSSGMMNQLPLILIPAFAVPFFIIVHVISLIQLRRAGAAERAAGHATPLSQSQAA